MLDDDGREGGSKSGNGERGLEGGEVARDDLAELREVTGEPLCGSSWVL